MSCMHPVCGGCYRRSEFYELCQCCETYIATDIIGFGFKEDKYIYKPKKGISLIMPETIRSKKVQKIK